MDAQSLNRMLEARVKDLAAHRGVGSQAEHKDKLEANRLILAKALGLHPAPPKTDLNAGITGIIERDGYRIEKLRYESRPGLLVTAHLYLPSGPGPFPLVLNPHGHWDKKKSTPWVQARGISLALKGFAALIVDSPGFSGGDDNDFNERREVGSHDDAMLAMGAPVQGQYVWDLVRGLDYCETRPEIDAKCVGITGASGGGTAAILALAFDTRIYAAAPVCAATSLIVNPHNGCLCNHLGGLSDLGDRADVLALRAPNPILLIGATDDPEFPAEGHRRTHEQLTAIYRHFKAESDVRLELVEGQHDYNRRMREAMLAFFLQHLKREPRRGHVPEPRPLTDGASNPYEAGTEPADSSELVVTAPDQRASITFRDVLHKGLEEPYPEPIVPLDRLVPWGRHGRLEPPATGQTLALHDHPLVAATAVKPSVPLAASEVDLRLCILLGLSIPELFAQVLHLSLPGKPEGWESSAVGSSGDAITSMIASVKTLVSSASPAEAPVKVVAEGPVASLTAQYLKLLRPSLELECSHHWSSWTEILETNQPELTIPNARYLQWPFDES